MTTESMSIPLDEGYLRRECPHCERQFKWHHGPTDDRPKDFADPAVYFCPYCGETAGPDAWWTQEQLKHARNVLTGPALREVADELRKVVKGSGGLLSMSVDYDEPMPPFALSEPSDMAIVVPPCHPWEPLKVAEDWIDPLRCLLCGSTFVLA